MNLLYVALGGGIGAVFRYLLGIFPICPFFPANTLLINILGCILLGFLSEILPPSIPLALFWKTGICGGFTTFSTFSLEAVQLLERKAWYAGGGYIFASLLCCVLGIVCGKKLGALLCQP